MKIKTVKARKTHICDKCTRKIKKGEIYEKRRHFFAEWIPHGRDDDTLEIWSYDHKTCFACINRRAIDKYKKENHNLRAEKRMKTCETGDFQPEWQGGWCDGVPDGGDVKFVCRKCNLNCG